jgi:hypothetical protein
VKWPCRIEERSAPGKEYWFAYLLRGGAMVAMVQAAHNGDGDEFAFARRSLRPRRFAGQSLVRAGVHVKWQ